MARASERVVRAGRPCHAFTALNTNGVETSGLNPAVPPGQKTVPGNNFASRSVSIGQHDQPMSKQLDEYAVAASAPGESQRNGINRREVPDMTKIWVANINRQRADYLERNRTSPQNKRLRKTSTSVSIAILALGFCALGLLSLINKHQPCEADRLSLEMAFSVIGGTASILLGGIFLVAGSLYWNR
jgi:hypothetical protein